MPNFKLSEEEAGAITAYLFSIGKESSFQFEHPSGSYAGIARREKSISKISAARHVTLSATMSASAMRAG